MTTGRRRALAAVSATGRGKKSAAIEIAAIGHTQSQGFCGDFFLKTFFVSDLDRLGECNRAACSRRAIDKECHHEPRRARRKIAGRPASLGGGAADRHRAAGEISDGLGDRPEEGVKFSKSPNCCNRAHHHARKTFAEPKV